MRRILQIVLALGLLPMSAAADLLPEALGLFTRASLESYQPEESAVFNEFGFEEGESAVYLSPEAERLVIRAVRFHDATGAFAAYQWTSPAGAKPIPYGEQASRTDEVTLIQLGNYLVRMEGAEPVDEHVELMLGFLPRVLMTPPPPLTRFVPQENRVPGSERHILGPVVLGRLAPDIPPSVAAFHFGTEGQFVRYESPAGELRLALFSYPSSQIARGQIEEFQKLPSVIAKRTGPLVAAVVSPASADEAQFLLAKVQYAADVTATPRPVGRHENLGTLILDIVVLCAVLVGLMIVGGVIVAGSRMLVSRYAPNSLFASSDGPGMVRLEIDKTQTSRRS